MKWHLSWFASKDMLVVSRVTLADQSTFDAKVVGFDQDKDVAVLHVDAPKDKLRPIPIGVSADLLVGQKVFAIGNPVSLILLHNCFILALFLLLLNTLDISYVTKSVIY